MGYKEKAGSFFNDKKLRQHQFSMESKLRYYERLGVLLPEYEKRYPNISRASNGSLRKRKHLSQLGQKVPLKAKPQSATTFFSKFKSFVFSRQDDSTTEAYPKRRRRLKSLDLPRNAAAMDVEEEEDEDDSDSVMDQLASRSSVSTSVTNLSPLVSKWDGKKKVNFNETTTVVLVHNNKKFLSKEEKHNLWYDKMEFMEMVMKNLTEMEHEKRLFLINRKIRLKKIAIELKKQSSATISFDDALLSPSRILSNRKQLFAKNKKAALSQPSGNHSRASFTIRKHSKSLDIGDLNYFTKVAP